MTSVSGRAPSILVNVSGTGYFPRTKLRIAACCSSTGSIVAAVLMPAGARYHADRLEIGRRGDVLQFEREVGEPGHVRDLGERGGDDRVLHGLVDAGDLLLARADEHRVPCGRVLLVVRLRGLRERHDRGRNRSELARGRGVDARAVRRRGEVLEPGRERDDREVAGELAPALPVTPVVGVVVLPPDDDDLLLLPHAASASPPSATPAPSRNRAGWREHVAIAGADLVDASRSTRRALPASPGSVAWCMSSRSAVIEPSSASLISIGS